MAPLNKKHLKSFARIAREYSLDLMLLFGSQTKTRTTLSSDVDIAVLPHKDFNPAASPSLEHALGQEFGNYNIDLTVLKHTSPLLLGEIAGNCQLLYEKKIGQFSAFKLSAMKRFADAQPIFRWREKFLERTIKTYKRELGQ